MGPDIDMKFHQEVMEIVSCDIIVGYYCIIVVNILLKKKVFQYFLVYFLTCMSVLIRELLEIITYPFEIKDEF